MIQKLGRDLKQLRSEPAVGSRFDESHLGEYYFLFEEDLKRLNRLIHSFDAQGIPLNKSYIDVENPKLHYYPITIGQYGLAVYHTFLKSGSEKDKNRFMNVVNWFYDNATIEGDSAFWITDVPKPEYRIQNPWKSAFSQSRAISILLRGWQLTKDQKYFRMASAGLDAFEHDISEGGVVARKPGGFDFYEEYVASKPTRVLDGHMFALFGVYDMVRASGEDEKSNTRARSIFDIGIEGLKNWLPQYDLGYWVRYNQCELENYPVDDPCTIGYLNLVTAQLDILSKISGEGALATYARKFRGYRKMSNVIRMYIKKFNTLRKLNRL